ncbi:hypothetical protein D3C86_1557690 [compost metagenome]
MKQPVLFIRIFNIGIDQQGVRFRMDIFHHDLEAIKAARFRQLYFAHEVYSKVLIYDTITGRKESQDMRNKMSFPIVQVIPVLLIVRKVNFFSSPETGLCLLIHLPDFRVFNRQKNKPVFVFF